MRWGLAGILVAIAVVAIGGYAIGAGKSSKDLVLCATKKSGDLSLASAKGKCAKGEKKLTVAKEGPVGAAGPQGAPGAPDSDAPEPVVYVKSPGTTACASQPGVFCKPGSLSGEWENYKDTFGTGSYERTGYYKDGEGFVHLVGVAGWISSGGIGGGYEPEGPFYLPPGYRPAATEMFLVPSGHAEGGTLGGYDRVEVRADGLVWTPGSLISLSPIVFKAA